MDNLMLKDLLTDREVLSDSIMNLLNVFERKYGQNIIKSSLEIRRFNGSNSASGKIVGLDLDVTL